MKKCSQGCTLARLHPSFRNHFVKKVLASFALLFSLLLAQSTFAQTAVTGTIRDAKGNPIAGASIQLKGKSVTTTSDNSGNFSINLPDKTGTLIITNVGYGNSEIAIGGKNSIDVTLQESSSTLDDVVIVGFGKQSRELLTTSISKLDNRTLENIPYANVLSALQGSIPGLRVQSISGQPGVAPRVILRGGTAINNLNASNPLYLVDGVIRPHINDVAADDIESIQVLKDAAATAIYGARASNGVILVTTKSAKAGVTRIAYSYDMTIADEGNRDLEYTNAREYIEHARQSVVWTGVKLDPATTVSRLTAPTGYGTGNNLLNSTAFTPQYLSPQNEHKLNEGWQSMPDPVDPTKTIIFKDTDFQKLRTQTARSHNHYLSVSGGTEKAKFNGGLGYMLGEGTALNSDYKRLTVNFNSSVQISPKLKVDGRLLYSNVDYRFIVADPTAQFTVLANTFYRSASLPNTAKYQFEDGTIAPGQSASAGNPHYYQIGPYAPVNANNRQNVTISVAGRWDIIPGLAFEPMISSFEEKGHGRSFQPGFLSGITTFNTTRTATQYYGNVRNYQADAVFTYTKAIVNHHFEAKAGYSYFDRKSYSVHSQGEAAAGDMIPTINASAIPRLAGGTNVITGLPVNSEGRLITEGVFGRITYDYDQKYLLNFTGRYDGASNLGESTRFGFFPGIGVGWNLHREKFWEQLPEFFSSFKLRATYGVNGNIQGLSEFGYQGLYSVNSQYNGAGAIQPGNLANQDLGWEESKVFDAGFDLGLLENRITLIVDYYRRVTENSITNVALPTSSGYSVVQTNNGSIENKGLEFDLNARILAPSSAFQWSMNLNFATVETKVLKLPDNGIEGNRQGGQNIWDPASKSYVWRPGYTAGGVFNNPASFMEGYRVGDMYAFKQIGIYATDADAATAPVDMSVPLDAVVPANGRKKYGGDVNFADMDGNGVIDNFDQVYVGNMFPTLTGGFANYFTYKSISLAVRTDFATGHTIYNYPKVVADGQLQGDLMPSKDFISKSWKKQGDITNTPRYLWQNSQGNITRNSTYYEKGDFLCIRELTLSYSLPQAMLRRIKLNGIRVNVTGNNLYYFTGYTGISPEDGGGDNGRYPNPRSLVLGLNVSL